MNKKIISLSLSKESIENLDKFANAMGKSRSDFLEWYIKIFFSSKEIRKRIEHIRNEQEELMKEMFGECLQHV